MAGKQTPGGKKVQIFPPPPKDFDPFKATEKDLMRHGLPLRPNATFFRNIGFAYIGRT